MALVDECTLWNKQGSNAEVTNSEIGDNGTDEGVGFTPCKFDDGFEHAANGTTVTFPTANLWTDFNQGMAEYWYRPRVPNEAIVNCQRTGGALEAFHWSVYNTGTGKGMSVSWRTDALALRWEIWGTVNIDKRSGIIAWVDLAQNVDGHLLFAWDTAGIDGGANTFRVYFNGALLMSDNTATNLTTYAPTLWLLEDYNNGRGVNNGAMDNLKIYKTCTEAYITDVINNRNNEGWPAPPGADIVPVICETKAPQIFTAGHDLVALGYVDDLPKIKELKTYRRDKLIMNSGSLPIKNFDDFVSLDNPVSIFNNSTWQYTPLRGYTRSGEMVLDAIIEDIPRNHVTKFGKFKYTDKFKKYADKTISYTSAVNETAADAARNILDAEGFTAYDNKSFQDSINQLVDNNCYIKASFNKEDDTTLQQALEILAEVGCMDCYSHLGVMYMRHYRPYTGGVKVALDDSDLLTAPRVSSLTKEIINDYRIYCADVDTPITDATAGDIGGVSRAKFGTKSLKEMGGKTTDQIVFKDAVSAQYIGECYIRRTNYNLDKANVRAIQAINFSLEEDHEDWVDLNTFMRLSFYDEHWNLKLWEIFMFERDFKGHMINISAYETEE